MAFTASSKRASKPLSILIEKFSRSLSDADVARFVLMLFFIANLRPLSHGFSFASLNELALQINVILLGAIGIALWRFELARTSMPLSKIGLCVALLSMVSFSLSALFGIEQSSGLVLSLDLLLLIFVPVKTADYKSGLLLTAAMAANSFWAPLVFQTFTAAIIAIDTTLLSWVYAFLRPDIILTGTTFQNKDFGIVVVGVCSVFSSASMALLAVATATQFFRPFVTKKDYLVLLASLIVMLGLNTLRLALTGWNKAQFLYWHDGAGVALYVNLQLLVIAVIAIIGAYWASQARKYA